MRCMTWRALSVNPYQLLPRFRQVQLLDMGGGGGGSGGGGVSGDNDGGSGCLPHLVGAVLSLAELDVAMKHEIESRV